MEVIIVLQLIWAVVSYFLNLRFVYFVQIGITFINLILGYSLISKINNPQDRSFELNNLLFLDSLNSVLLLVILTISFFVSVYSVGYMKRELKTGISEKKLNEYYFWMNLFIFAMLVVTLSNNFGILWIAIEGTTLATAFLISYYRNKEAVEAGWKYIMLCSIGIGLALFGIILLYYSSFSVLGHGLQSLNWTNIYDVSNKLNPKLLMLAFIFVLVGFGTKVGFAPLHFWLPDAHSQAPTPISALMSGVLLNCAFYSILRVQAIIINNGYGYDTSKYLMFFGVLTVVVSALFIIRQVDYKRLLAYSSMEHMAIIAFAFSVNTKLSIFAGVYHLINHAIVKTSIFMTVGSILTSFHTRDIFSIRGLFKALPYTSIALILSMFAITGTPPFSVFMSKLFILISSFKAGFVISSIILMLALVLIFGGFVYHFLNMLMGDAEKRYKEDPLILLPPFVLLFLSLVLSFYIPEKVLMLINNIPEILGVKNG